MVAVIGDRGAMTPAQNFYTTVCNFGPAIFLGFLKSVWAGVFAVVVTFALSFALTFLVSSRISSERMLTWAWIKPGVVALIVLTISWNLF